MVEVVARARWFAKGAPRGTGGTELTFFEDRSGSRAMLDRRALAPGEPAGSTYLRDGLLVVLGVVAVGLLLGRRSMRGGAPPSPSSDEEGTGADATVRAIPDPAGVPGPPSGPPAQEPAHSPGGETPPRRRPAPRDAVPPTPPSFAESPRPEDPTGRSTEEDLDGAPAEGVPSGGSSGTPAGERAASAEEPPAAPEVAEHPTEEAPSILEDLPPPPQASDVELTPPPSTPDVAQELPPPPPTEDAASIAEEMPPPPEVAEAELPPPPPATRNVIDELPPPPVPEELNVGDAPAAPETEPSVEPVVESPRAEEPRGRRRVTATAAARRIAGELGVDLLEVEGTGRNGKITAEDVRKRGEQTRS